VNPEGIPGKWRAVDWVVEHNNLSLKVSEHLTINSLCKQRHHQRKYGGKFSNHTRQYILKESALLGVFRQTIKTVEHLFNLVSKKAFSCVTGRKAEYLLPDTYGDGVYALYNAAVDDTSQETHDTEDLDGVSAMGDILGEDEAAEVAESDVECVEDDLD
jgi:hypothetical protein